MRRTKPWLTLILSGATAAAVIAGVYAALHSPLFMVRVVEVADQPEDAPLEAKEISSLAAVPLGEVSLFDVNLRSIEKRLTSNSWVRSVILTKRFPQTLAIQVVYRNPVGLLQGARGSLQYIDEDGSLFGPVSLRSRPDLPLVAGVPANPSDPSFQNALTLLKTWGTYTWSVANQVSQLSYDPEEGYQLWVTFAPTQRVVVTLGQDFDGIQQPEHLSRIDAVLRYVSTKAIAIRQIYADANKKIVVRTVRGS